MTNAGVSGNGPGRWTRTGFVVLAVGQGVAAVWALASPRSFYDDFPGGGRQWVSALPPYNEHLTIDYASGAIALTLLAVLAAVILERRVVQVAAATWVVFALPHFVYHLTTLEVYSTTDAVGNAVTLGLAVVIPLAILVGLRAAPAPAGRGAGR